MIFQDSNPETALSWANEINWPILKPAPNLDILIRIVDEVDWCISYEFDTDRLNFQYKNGHRPGTPEEEQTALIFLENYDLTRKNEFKDCIAKKTRNLLNEYDSECRTKIAMTLWSAAVRTAKTLSIKSRSKQV